MEELWKLQKPGEAFEGGSFLGRAHTEEILGVEKLLGHAEFGLLCLYLWLRHISVRLAPPHLVYSCDLATGDEGIWEVDQAAKDAVDSNEQT